MPLEPYRTHSSQRARVRSGCVRSAERGPSSGHGETLDHHRWRCVVIRVGNSLGSELMRSPCGWSGADGCVPVLKNPLRNLVHALGPLARARLRILTAYRTRITGRRSH